MLRRRLTTPRAAVVVALAGVLAAAIAVAPSLAGPSFLTRNGAAHTYVSNAKAAALFLKKKAAANTYVSKVDAPLPPVAAIAAGSATWANDGTTAQYIPTAFTSFGLPGTGPVVITFSGAATCTSAKPTAELACPIQIVVDGQSTGKVNFAPATAGSPTPAALVHTLTQTTVLTKGGHTVAIQYAGAKSVAFALKSWNLAVQGYPQKPEAPTTDTGTTDEGGK